MYIFWITFRRILVLTETDTIQIEITGDEAKMTNNSNFILLSFSILQIDENVMSAKGNMTIGIVNGKENYTTIKVSFGDVIDEINKLVADTSTDANIELFWEGIINPF